MRDVQLLDRHDLIPLTKFSPTPLPVEGQRVLQQIDWHDLSLGDAVDDALPVNAAALAPRWRP